MLHGWIRRPASWAFCIGIIAGLGTMPASARDGFKRLEAQASVPLAAGERFVAADAFRVGGEIGGRTVRYIGLDFVRNFMGIVEEGSPEGTVHVYSLLYTLGDASLLKALGGTEAASATTLSAIYRVMALGEAGGSHTDWRSNLAYVRSPVDGRLWAIHWTVGHHGGWSIAAVHVPHSHLDWRSGTRVFVARPTEAGDDQAVLGR